MKPYNRDEPMIVLFMRYLNGKNCTGAKNRSQRTKATMETVPTTSMEITVPDAQPLDCPLARENGRRMRENAAVQRRRPRTISCKYMLSDWTGILMYHQTRRHST